MVGLRFRYQNCVAPYSKIVPRSKSKLGLGIPSLKSSVLFRLQLIQRNTKPEFQARVFRDPRDPMIQ